VARSGGVEPTLGLTEDLLFTTGAPLRSGASVKFVRKSLISSPRGVVVALLSVASEDAVDEAMVRLLGPDEAMSAAPRDRPRRPSSNPRHSAWEISAWERYVFTRGIDPKVSI